MEGFGDTNIEIICAKCGGLIHLECRGMTQGKPDQLRAAAHQHGDRTCEGSYRELTIALALQPAAPKVREVRVSRLKDGKLPGRALAIEAEIVSVRRALPEETRAGCAFDGEDEPE